MNYIAENISIYEKLFCKEIINTYFLTEGIKIRPVLRMKNFKPGSEDHNGIPEIDLTIEGVPANEPKLEIKKVDKNKDISFLKTIAKNIDEEVFDFICQKADHLNVDNFEGVQEILDRIFIFFNQSYKANLRSYQNKWVVCSSKIFETYFVDYPNFHISDEQRISCFTKKGVINQRYNLYTKTDMQEDKIIIGSKGNYSLETLLCLNIDYLFRKEKETADSIEYYSRYALDYDNKPYSYLVLTASEPIPQKEVEDLATWGDDAQTSPASYLAEGEE